MLMHASITLLLRAFGLPVCLWIFSNLAYGAPQLEFESYARPFAANSLWNSSPVAPEFSSYTIPTSSYFPSIHEGTYSTGCFLAEKSDLPVTIKAAAGKKGVWDADAETFRPELILPHWPADVEPAPGSDGHADVFDISTGIIHSFWKLRRNGDEWSATQYAWAKLNGRGWGDPAHYFQGARAAAVPSCAGIIRKSELNDGDEMYRHALAMSLTYNGLSANPAYIYPATSADTDYAKNTGEIPEGALLMLPPSFNVSNIKTPALKKIANTLKTFGAYVVDRNYGTPFIIYIENGSGLKLHKNGWNNAAGNDLNLIRQSLRQVTSAQTWMDGNGNRFTPQNNLNLLSMRGPWNLSSGRTLGQFDTWQQAVVFGQTNSRTTQLNNSVRSLNPTSWAKPRQGEQYKLTATTTGGAKLRLKIIDTKLNKPVFDSNELDNNQSVTFQWPTNEYATIVFATSGIGESSSVSGTLLKVE